MGTAQPAALRHLELVTRSILVVVIQVAALAGEARLPEQAPMVIIVPAIQVARRQLEEGREVTGMALAPSQELMVERPAAEAALAGTVKALDQAAQERSS